VKRINIPREDLEQFQKWLEDQKAIGQRSMRYIPEPSHALYWRGVAECAEWALKALKEVLDKE
tara:strand:- start:337 stop:525 length:189 start_codon:yes stop_codon:yes gene_type:complete